MTIDIAFDSQHIWHPYTSMTKPIPTYPVVNASGVYIELETGEKLIDGMASWWSVLHGYNNDAINAAVKRQLDKFSHVMFGGLTHEPAVTLCKTLVQISPDGLEKVFLSDSGSVAVEVAIKMALQYWHSVNKPEKNRLLSLRNGYHGDTFGAMSVCDPVTGMHSLFKGFMAENQFAPAPKTQFHQPWNEQDIEPLEQLLKTHGSSLAALILEPIVQGAGGMRIYHPEYLRRCRQLCTQYDVLLIADEIATGFARTGKMFACEHAGISPDILCVGKSLTGGYMTLAATLTTAHIANAISDGEAGVFMHGPTFMGNPLACSAANASLDLLLSQDWQHTISQLESWLNKHLQPLAQHDRVNEVRVLGAIGVVEANQAVNMAEIQREFVNAGVWIRPFGKLIYIMPPYITQQNEIAILANAISNVLNNDSCFIPR